MYALVLLVVVIVAILLCCCGAAAVGFSMVRKKQKLGDAEQGGGSAGGVVVLQAPQPTPTVQVVQQQSAVTGVVPGQQAQPTVATAPAYVPPAEEDFSAMTVKQLRERAKSNGIADSQIENARDSDDPKGELIRLIGAQP